MYAHTASSAKGSEAVRASNRRSRLNGSSTQSQRIDARADHEAILLPNGNVLFIGGSSRDLNGAELYDPATGKWKTSGRSTGP